ncbi:MAG TPA: hypothetical protein VD731_01080 [Nitrosopumilaceae archaeon]|nr:hypothetical protein [Nitrosopumilaceae archaeon]
MKITMTHNQVLMITLVIASIGGTYAISTGFDLTLDSTGKSAPSGALLTGNVKVTQYDESGNIIAYRQSDNHIVFHGMEIIMGQVFNGVNDTYATKVRPVSHMEIGLAGDPGVYATALRWNDTDVVDPVIDTNPLCARVVAVIDNVTQGNSHKSPSTCHGTEGFGANPCSAQMNVTARSTFTGANCAAASIDEAGIFNDPAGGLMFARNTFGSVTLNPLDSLALDWEFTFTDS